MVQTNDLELFQSYIHREGGTKHTPLLVSDYSTACLSFRRHREPDPDPA